MFKRSSNVSDSQISDSAVQRCQEILQAFSSVTGDQTNRRESRDPSQLPVQVLPLIQRQQVGFIQHQENSVCGNEDRNTRGTVRKRVRLQLLRHLHRSQCSDTFVTPVSGCSGRERTLFRCCLRNSAASGALAGR